MAVELITKDDLIAFKTEMIEAVRGEIKQVTGIKDVLKSEDVRKMLGISAGTLQTLRVNGTLPFSKLLGTCYYERADVLNALRKNKQHVPGKPGTRGE